MGKNYEYQEEMIHAWERLWKSRDLELQFQWQRSVFLSAFMLLLYTGYGYVLLKLVSDDIGKDGGTLFHLIAFVISFMGVIFSSLWIMMAKGSKFWYEAYEDSIGKFNSEYSPKYLWWPHGVEEFNIRSVESSILSGKSFRYSPSKVNIIIG